CVGAAGSVRAYEPNERAFYWLHRNVSEVVKSAVTLDCRAVGDTIGMAQFFVPLPCAENQGVGGYAIWAVRPLRTAPYYRLEPLPARDWYGNCLAIHKSGADTTASGS